MDETATTSADESDSYGDSDVVADMERKVEDFDSQTKRQDIDTYPKPGPENSIITYDHPCPFEGEEFAWRRNAESIYHFLHVRLPPSQTWAKPGRSYIWISNPHVRHTSWKEARNQHIPGAEDEMPTDGDIATLMEAGEERLAFVSSFIEDSQKRGVLFDRYRFEKQCDKAGADAAKDILELAQDIGVTFGKWLIFCDTREVDRIWDIIVNATLADQLGVAAKVAARSSQDSIESILICVYTRNFKDKKDVRRVGIKLQELGVIKDGDTLYYKPDAYTYLGIASGNPWKIHASIYNSRNLKLVNG
ncbi:hypothetical protein F4679DRAFT_540881 [Xylaria curta]|nr:hypothetical protein F4679DRAFT_540881 [Xylaria curta]